MRSRVAGLRVRVDSAQQQAIELRDDGSGRIEERQVAEMRVLAMLDDPEMAPDLRRKRPEDPQLAQRHDDDRAAILRASEREAGVKAAVERWREEEIVRPAAIARRRDLREHGFLGVPLQRREF